MVNQADRPGAAASPVTQELLGILGLPAQMMAMVQQLNHNLETLQDAGVMERLDRLNTNLESLAPQLKKLTDFLERVTG